MDGFFINLDALARLCELQEAHKLTPSAFAVGIALCRFMGHRDECWPSREALVKKSGVKRIPTVSDALKELADPELDFIEKRRGQRGNHYHFRRNRNRIVGSNPHVTETVTSELSDDTESVTSESNLQNPDDTVSVLSHVTETVTSYTLQENKKENNMGGSVSPPPQPPHATPPTSSKTTEESSPPQPTQKQREAALRVIARYEEKVKPRKLDDKMKRSEQKKRLYDLFAGGHTEEEMNRAIDAFAEKWHKDDGGAPEKIQYRYGFRRFFGASENLWVNYPGTVAVATVAPERPKPTGAYEQMQAAQREAKRLMEERHDREPANA